MDKNEEEFSNGMWDDLDDDDDSDNEPEKNKYIDNIEESFKLVTSILSINEIETKEDVILGNLANLIEKDYKELAAKEDYNDEITQYEKITNLYSRLEDVVNFPFLENKTIIAVGGSFSAGKSRFINSILDEDVLPTDTTPTTSIPTFISRDDKSNYHILNTFGNIIDIDKDALKALTHAFFERYKLSFAHIIKNIILHSKNFKYENIVFLDTPGYTKSERLKKEDNTDEAVARKHLADADILLWLIDIEKGTIPQNDQEFIDKLNFSKPIFIIFTKADHKTEKDIADIIKTTKELLKNTGLSVAGIAAYSSKDNKHYAGDNIFNFISKINNEEVSSNIPETAEEVFDVYLKFHKEKLERNRKTIGVFNQMAVFAENDKKIKKELNGLKNNLKKEIEFEKKIIEEFKSLKIKFDLEIKKIMNRINIKRKRKKENKKKSRNQRNRLIIYYQGSRSHCYYRTSKGWKDAPGDLMDYSEINGYKKIEIELNEMKETEICFNTFNHNWDDNNSKNYKFSAGIYTFDENDIVNKIKKGKPRAIIYYKGSKSHCHYRISEGWKDAPGDLMSNSEIEGYKKIEIELNEMKETEVCFNIFNHNWDNNNDKNYKFSAGIYIFDENNTVNKITHILHPE